MKDIKISFLNGKTRIIQDVEAHHYMSTSNTLKVETDGRTYYFPMANIQEIEIAYPEKRHA